jgi:hypothetical protein
MITVPRLADQGATLAVSRVATSPPAVLTTGNCILGPPTTNGPLRGCWCNKVAGSKVGWYRFRWQAADLMQVHPWAPRCQEARSLTRQAQTFFGPIGAHPGDAASRRVQAQRTAGCHPVAGLESLQIDAAGQHGLRAQAQTYGHGRADDQRAVSQAADQAEPWAPALEPRCRDGSQQRGAPAAHRPEDAIPLSA